MPRYEYALIPVGLDGVIKITALSSEPLKGITIDVDYSQVFSAFPSIPGNVLAAVLTPELQLVMIDRGGNETDEADG